MRLDPQALSDNETNEASRVALTASKSSTGGWPRDILTIIAKIERRHSPGAFRRHCGKQWHAEHHSIRSTLQSSTPSEF